MAVVVVGGQSRGVGKTAVIAGLIARLPEMHWTALKITQHPHGLDESDRTLALAEERDAFSGNDTARFLAAGAVRSLWVRVHPGILAKAMPHIQRELAAAENAILESNSVMQFLQPDVYLSVLDEGIEDFKDSALRFLDRADAVLVRETETEPRWTGVSAKLLAGKPRFVIAPPEFVTDAVVEFLRGRIAH